MNRRAFIRNTAYGAAAALFLRSDVEPVQPEGAFVYAGESLIDGAEGAGSWRVDVSRAQGVQATDIKKTPLAAGDVASKNLVLGNLRGDVRVPAGCENVFVYQGTLAGVQDMEAVQPEAGSVSAQKSPLRLKMHGIMFDANDVPQPAQLLTLRLPSTHCPNVFFYNDRGEIVAATRGKTLDARIAEAPRALAIGDETWHSTNLSGLVLERYRATRDRVGEAMDTELFDQTLAPDGARAMVGGMLRHAAKALDPNWVYAPGWQEKAPTLQR